MKPALPRSKGHVVATITCAGRARGLLSSLLLANKPAITPWHRTGWGLYSTRRFTATNTVYALVYIVAAAVVVTGVFLMVTALTS